VGTRAAARPSGESERATATAGIWFAIVWLPILVRLALVAFVALFILRRVFRSRPGTPAGPTGPSAGAGPEGGPGSGRGDLVPTLASEA
jgi:hypothetical protein